MVLLFELNSVARENLKAKKAVLVDRNGKEIPYTDESAWLWAGYAVTSLDGHFPARITLDAVFSETEKQPDEFTV